MVERFLDETNDVQTTAHGAVVKSLVGFLLVASCLTLARCEQVAAEGAAAPYKLISSGEMENLWPTERFSSEINIARRALVNRLGTDLAVLCG